MIKRRGNPNWGKAWPTSFAAYTPTSFEGAVKMLGLSPDDFEASILLKEWVFKNKNQKYVPLELLRAWGFAAEVGL